MKKRTIRPRTAHSTQRRRRPLSRDDQLVRNPVFQAALTSSVKTELARMATQAGIHALTGDAHLSHGPAGLRGIARRRAARTGPAAQRLMDKVDTWALTAGALRFDELMATPGGGIGTDDVHTAPRRAA